MSRMHHRLRSVCLLILALAAVFASPIATAQNDESNAPETLLSADDTGSNTAAASPWVQYVEDHLPDVLVTNAFLTLKVWQWIGLALATNGVPRSACVDVIVVSKNKARTNRPS